MQSMPFDGGSCNDGQALYWPVIGPCQVVPHWSLAMSWGGRGRNQRGVGPYLDDIIIASSDDDILHWVMQDGEDL